MATETPVNLSATGHLPCGNVPFHQGVCRDAYLKRRTCEHCESIVATNDDATINDPAPVGPPAESATRADWEAFAVKSGMTADDAAGFANKATLIAAVTDVTVTDV